MNTPTLDIQLLGKEYTVACPPEERAALQAAASLLNERLSLASGKSKFTGERLAVMVALNLAHELLANSKAAEVTTAPAPTTADNALDSDAFARRIQGIETRIDAVLNQSEAAQ